MVRKYIISALLLAAVASSCIAAGDHGHRLIGKSFFVRSVLRTNQEIDKSRLGFSEFYSADQKRGRLNLNVLKSVEGMSDHFYDSGLDEGIGYFPKQTSCEKYDLKKMHDTYFSQMTELVDLFNLADKEIGDDVKFITGPAKLLFLIANRKDQLRVRSADENQELRIRSHQVICTDLSINLSQDLDLDLTIHYDKLTFSLETSPQNDVPLQVIVKNGKEAKFLFIDFYQFAQLNSDIKVYGAEFLDDKNQDLGLDLFNFPLAANCSRLLPANDLTSRDLLKKSTLDQAKFSFIVETKYAHALNSEAEHFVAFDGLRSSLRIDSVRKVSNSVEESTEILDYSANRRYIMAKNPRFSMLDGVNGEKSLDKLTCVPMRIDPYRMSRQQGLKWDLMMFLTGARQFSYMGRGRVGTIPALVYEGYSDFLPNWFSKPTLFKSVTGNNFLLHLDETAKKTVNNEAGSKYGILLYVADEGGNRSATDVRFLLMEHVNLDHSPGGASRRILKSKFTNFQWSLSDAPNGDHVRDLFTQHYDNCVELSDQGKSTRVELILEEDVNKSDSHALDWIEDWHLRNEALISSLIDVLNLQSFLIRDLETKLIEEPKRSIVATFNLVEGPKTMYQIFYVGSVALGSLKERDNSKSTNVHSISQCLWMLGQNRRAYLYFNGFTDTCIMIPQTDADSNTAFEMMENANSDLFAVEAHREDMIGKSWISKLGMRELENKLIHFERPINGLRKDDPNSLMTMMRIKKIRVPSLNYLEDDENIEIQKALTFPGYGLTKQSSYKLFSSDDIQNKQMSVSQCRAACLKEVECHSFSYCADLPEFRCHLSLVSFQQSGIIEQLAKAPVGRRFQLEISKADSAGGFPNITKQMVELVRDKKCELHNKVYMDMFQRHWISERSIAGLQLHAVDGKEQCAEICFTRSLESLKSSSVFLKQLRDLIGEDGSLAPFNEEVDSSKADLIQNLRKEHLQALDKFCGWFLYLDSSTSEDGLKLLASMKLGPPDKTEYCALNEPDFDKNSDTADLNETENSVRFDFGTYKFDFTHLYERQFGYGAKESPINWDEVDAFRLAKTGVASQEQLAMLNRALAQGKNFQMQIDADPERCALSCFTQFPTIWPACRSFDLIYIHKPNEKPTRICKLNTISLGSHQDDAASPSGNIDMRDYGKSKEYQIWHHEPLFGLVSDELDLDYILDSLSRHNPDDQYQVLAPQRTQKQLGSSLWFYLIIVMTLVGGLFLGMKSAYWLLNFLQSRPKASEERPLENLINSTTLNLSPDN